MNSESGFRTIIARADGGVSVLAASAKRQGAASMDALLNNAERKASAGTVVGRVRMQDAPSDRRLRNAWVIADGKVTVDLAKARELRRNQWADEGGELQDFINKKLLPRAKIRRDTAAVAQLNAAAQNIDAMLDDLGRRIDTMTEAELASEKPNWPQLGVKRESV